MEQAYRRLIQRLGEHPLVEEVDANYYYIRVIWKSGIKERLIIQRQENDAFRRLRYMKSPVYRPQFMPKALWWEDIYNGKEIKPNYLEDVNEFEYDIDKFPNLINWKWSDFRKGRFYDRLIFQHTVLQYVIDNKWQELKYPEHTLNRSLQLLVEEDLNKYQHPSRLQVRSFHGKERPGAKLLEHFMPYDCYGRDDPYFLFKTENPKDIKRIYLAIRNIISRNRRAAKKGRKKMMDFNYFTIMNSITRIGTKYQYHQSAPYRFRQIGLYRKMIQHFELSEKSFYDIDPCMGEKAMACFLEKCPYIYRPVCPFDECGPALMDYIGADYCEDDGTRHDFSILDRGMRYDEDYYEECFELLSQKVDTLIVFVPDDEINKWTDRHPPDESIQLKYSGSPLKTGRLLVYNF